MLLLWCVAWIVQAQTTPPPTGIEDNPEDLAADARDSELIRNLLSQSPAMDEIYLDPERREQVAASTHALVEAAQRMLQRQDGRLQRANALVDSSRAPATILPPLIEEMRRRLETVTLTMDHARLVDEMVQDARQMHSARGMRRSAFMERFPGRGVYSPASIKVVSSAFARQFHHPLPISAHGATATHVAMGFDHRGRFDVALHPDAPEGVWLRKYLQSLGIPYYAFRRAVPGSATAPHVHIGPGSTRIRHA